MTTPTDDLAQALRALYEENMDYIRLNHLGAENNQVLQRARAALEAYESRAQPASVSDGWVMVPRKISEMQADILGMPAAWYERAVSTASRFGHTFAAPQPPTKENDDEL